jgi:hypothetical protein
MKVHICMGVLKITVLESILISASECIFAQEEKSWTVFACQAKAVQTPK